MSWSGKLRPLRILAVPSDDGFGPSALLSYVVKALLSLAPRAEVTIWNDFAHDFNRQIYGREIDARRVAVERRWNLIQLARPDGDVCVEATLRLMGGYAAASPRYAEDADASRFDLVIDFGAPAAARWAGRHSLPQISIFDHAWSKTLEMIGGPSSGRRWRSLVEAIASDERAVQRLLLFPEFIDPSPFPEHWRGMLGNDRVLPFEGVLRQPVFWSRRRAREFLGLDNDDPTILVQGGGSSVWRRPLGKLLAQVSDEKNRRRLRRRNINLVVWFPDGALSDAENRKLTRYSRIVRLMPVRGGTMQTILPAVDFLFTRAGGGSVNDAVAHRTPFVCVREPGQPQIEAILNECERRGLTHAVDLAEFDADPLGVILRQYVQMSVMRSTWQRRLRRIPRDGQKAVALQILRLLR